MPWLTGDTIPTIDFVCRRVVIPNDLALIIAVNGALDELTNAYNWEQFGTVTPDEAATAMNVMFAQYLQGEACLIGAIIPYATQDAPNGTLPCDGGTYLRVDYPDLYAALDAIYVIDADSFSTPDLRGRSILGTGTGPGLTERAMGDSGGEEKHVLDVAEMPEHSHTTQPHSHSDSGHTHFVPIPTFLAIEPGEAPTYTPLGVPVGGQTSLPGFANIVAAGVTVDNTGNGDGHENMPPFHALRYCIVAQ